MAKKIKKQNKTCKKETNKLNSRSLTKFDLCGEYTPLFFF